MTPARPGSLPDTLNQSHDLTERIRKERDEAVELLVRARIRLNSNSITSRAFLAEIDALLKRIGK